MDDPFKRFVEITTLLIIVGGLYFARDQAKKLSDSINLATWTSISSENLDLDNALLNNTDLLPFVYDGCDISENDRRYQRARALIYEMLDYYDGV